MASRTIENYVKQIYLEQQQTPADQPVAMGRLATVMNVVPGTATTMVKALADSGLVHYSPRSGVQLTPAGSELALRVLRRHRLVELFLVRVLGFDWSEVHAEAEELEHVISEKLLEKIDILLEHPSTDPHGDPIPSSTLQVAPPDLQSLATCTLHQRVEITRILDQEPGFLQFAKHNGLQPGARWAVEERSAQADAVGVVREAGAAGANAGMVMLSTGAAGKFLVRGVSSQPV